MTILLRTFAIGFLACGALDDPPVAIQNQATRGLAAIRVGGVAEQSFEPSLLARPLEPGQSGYARIACGRYDVLVTDDAGRRCALTNQPLCFEREPWTIDDVTLESCRWQ